MADDDKRKGMGIAGVIVAIIIVGLLIWALVAAFDDNGDDDFVNPNGPTTEQQQTDTGNNQFLDNEQAEPQQQTQTDDSTNTDQQDTGTQLEGNLETNTAP